MREIKFRAWCKIDNSMIIPITLQEVIFQRKSNFSLEQLNQDVIFMQFTGLHDKNGKEIYEGDIVEFEQFKEKKKGKIVFNYKTCSFEVWVTIVVGAYGEKATNQYLICHCDCIEVIGDIYQNPELLNG